MNTDLWSILGNSFKKAYLDGFKKKAITGLVIALIFIIIVTIIVTVILKVNEEETSKTQGSHLLNAKNLNPFEPLLSREEFIECVQNYSPAGNKISYQNNMAPYAADFYDVCTQYHVCPEYAFAHACLETGYGSYFIQPNNFFGYNATNDNPGGNASSYGSAADSIKAYCENFISRATPETSQYKATYARAQEFATILPETFSGLPEESLYVLHSNYAVLDDTHGKKWDANWFYKQTKGTTCGHANGTPTTLQEYAEYAEYTVNKRVEILQDIFGSKLILVTSNSEIVNKAAEIFTYISQNNFTYGSTSIPPSGRVIDCSAFVDWVLYELGYTDFGGGQRDTDWWYNKLDVSTYGWQSFYIGSNDISVLQPGDIIVLRETSKNKVTGKNDYRHHMQIFVSAKDETHAYVYDCGGTSNWSVNTPTNGESTFWGYEKAKVIRIAPNTMGGSEEQ